MAFTQPIPNAPENFADPYNLIGVAGTGFAKVCRFAVRISRPPMFTRLGPVGLDVPHILRDMTFLCEAGELAGRGFDTVDIRYYGPMQKIPNNVQYNDMNLTFLCRREMNEKRFFDLWHNKINPPDTYNFAYLDEFSTNIDVFQFGEDGKATYMQTLVKAWPISVNPMQTLWADDQIARLTVTITYQRWTTLDFTKTMSQLSTLVSGASAPREGFGSILNSDTKQ